MNANLGVIGTGSYLPELVVGNDEVGAAAGVGGEWIRQRTGITARRRAAPHEAASDLAANAALRALESAGVKPAQLRYIVVATSTPDHPQPATACLVQHRIGAVHAAAFDVNAVCSGFVFALGVMHRMLSVEPDGYGLVIGADVYSRILDGADRKTAILFGDGAGAVVVGPTELDQGLLGLSLISDGSAHEIIRVPAGGSRLPASPATLADGEHFFKMDGRAVRDFVSDRVPPILRQLLRGAGVVPSAVDHFIPHQANGVMLDGLARELGLRAQMRLTVHKYGNTGAASVPITLDEAVRSGSIRRGDLVLMAGFGGGMAVGAALLRWAGVGQGNVDADVVPAPRSRVHIG
ncbi:3-oxoacyl-ACP synthase III family protein [Saccharothrix syringae]|uniref:Beta-ketoacyl-ACP synthase III n=1 Tax=Saccharothrix syringae TaxID=103733 RepID=A0A5Q0GWW2_SACSY|nr:beta-ketoacyl-ACP synthase 3 [Saccharothrix syringae]QFZ17842.1 beta-ketoacyl-ACP synthase III [Saccharothrix syringae]